MAEQSRPPLILELTERDANRLSYIASGRKNVRVRCIAVITKTGKAPRVKLNINGSEQAVSSLFRTAADDKYPVPPVRRLQAR